MYRVFIVEDESIVREGLKTRVPWEQHGFTFAGEAADGEMALPLIRKIRPDVLITDIRMPFMDGLSLCRMVKSELPDIRIFILSGYDDFEYARKAIEIGVDRYLTKPVTSRAVTQALDELRGKLDSEKEKEMNSLRSREERETFEQFRRRTFFEKVFAGTLTVEQIYREAQDLGIDLFGPSYALILADVFMAGSAPEGNAESREDLRICREDIIRYFLRHPEFVFLRWTNESFCIVVRGDEKAVEEYIRNACYAVAKHAEAYGGRLDYILCLSDPVSRFSSLRECYAQVLRFFVCRYRGTAQRVITESVYREISGAEILPRGEERTRGAAAPAREEAGRGGAAESADVGSLLRDALAYIETHYTEEALSLNGVAEAMNVSPGYFSSLFSQKMQMTYVEYVTNRRMERARQLLRETGMHTAEVAALTGYRDPNYFRSVFKKMTGCTPKEYRSRHQRIPGGGAHDDPRTSSQ